MEKKNVKRLHIQERGNLYIPRKKTGNRNKEKDEEEKYPNVIKKQKLEIDIK